jgi:hypothetical protein
MRGMTAFGQALAFMPGQLALALCLAVLIALAVGLVIVSIVFGGNRRSLRAGRLRLPGKQGEADQRRQDP